MEFVQPKVFLIGHTEIAQEGLDAYLSHIKTNWKGADPWMDDIVTASELMPEIMGRLCYRSWEPGMNRNVNKVRQGNKTYLENIKKQRHGSVLEHSMFNFIFADVSRVFTHELVRHRVGTAISQESLRYVRSDTINMYAPIAFHEDEWAMSIFGDTVKQLETLQKSLSDHFDLDNEKNFGRKKRITSAMRRLAPDGLSTSIGWSANARTLYNVIQKRTHPSAEEEIRVVFGQVAEIVKEKFPNLFNDLVFQEVGEEKGVYWYASPNGEI